MFKISSSIKSFLKNLMNSVIDLHEQAYRDRYLVKDEILHPIPSSASQIEVGDILIFRYVLSGRISLDWDRMVLIAGCKRGKGGIFKGLTTGNTLVSCFKLETGSSTDVVSFIIKELYNVHKPSENLTAGLKALVGRDSYRTYILSSMKKIYKLYIPEETLRAEKHGDQ